MLKIDNAEVRARQLSKLQQLKGTRDVAAVESALDALTNAAQGDGNLLEFAIRAARAKATVGEISLALEKVFGRHVADGADHLRRLPQGDRRKPRRRPRAGEGRRLREEDTARKPRILVAKMGQDGHDRGQKVIATAFADLGFDVTVGAMFQTPEEIAKLAVDHDVHIVGASSLAAGHLTLIPELKEALEKLGARGHPDRRRRRHPAAGLRRGSGSRRRRNLPAGNGDPGGGGAVDGQAGGGLSAPMPRGP